MKGAIQAQAAIVTLAPTIPCGMCAFHLCSEAVGNNTLSGQQMSAIHVEFPSLLIKIPSFPVQPPLSQRYILDICQFLFFFFICTSNLYTFSLMAEP